MGRPNPADTFRDPCARHTSAREVAQVVQRLAHAPIPRGLAAEGGYDRILAGEYPRRGDAVPGWREDAAAGLRPYGLDAESAAERAGSAARRARDAFEDGPAAGAAGKVGETARRVRDAFERGFSGRGDAPKEEPAQ